MTERAGIGRAPVVDTIQVIRVNANRGAGDKDDPVREVTFLYDMGGTLIVERDPVEGITHFLRDGVDQFGDPIDYDHPVAKLARLIEAADIAIEYRDQHMEELTPEGFASLEPLRHAVRQARK